MNRVAATLATLKKNGQKAFIPYIMGGDPDLAATPSLIQLLAGQGADVIEVGVPFSDPLADGPVIQAAGIRALNNGGTLEKLLDTIRPIVTSLEIPIILMIYYNMIYQRGHRRFFEILKESGCSGLIIPDLLPDEAGEIRSLAKEFEIGLNFLVAPTSSGRRIKQAAEASTGFVYAVSLKGVTGARNTLPPELPQFLNKIRAVTDKPVAVGFGISTPEQAGIVAGIADGVIVGSAIVKAVNQDGTFETVTNLTQRLRRAIKNS